VNAGKKEIYMKITRKDLVKMEKCYAVSVMNIDKKPYVFYATEGNGSCVAFDCDTLSDQKVIWNEPGGTMNMVAIPDSEDFLAIQKFFRLYDWEEATLVWAKTCGKGVYTTKPILQLAYLHRIGIVESNNKRYLVCCTLAEHKATVDDWSYPGKVYAGKLPEDLNKPFKLQILMDDMTQNHGFARVEWNSKQAVMITGRNGVFIITPPETDSAGWRIEKIMEQAVSDADMIDIDGDGEMEIATIEQFHGKFFRVYKKIDEKYVMIFEHQEKAEFYHVVKSGIINGKPVFVGGCRRGKQQLFLVKAEDNNNSRLETVLIDEGVGPSNIEISNLSEGDIIFSANREIGYATVYQIKG